MYAIWGLFIGVICAAAVFLTCSQQHVVDVVSPGTCSATALLQGSVLISYLTLYLAVISSLSLVSVLCCVAY